MSKRKAVNRKVPDRSAAIDIDGQKQIFVSPKFSRSQLSYLSSPVLELIDSIFTDYPKRAQELLRKPIEVNYELSEFEKGLIKVAAKRILEAEISVERNLGSQKNALKWVRNKALAIQDELKKAGLPLYERQRPITCALFNDDHDLLVVESNHNAKVRTEHAELRLLKRVREARLEKGNYYLVTSLQSCRMCAGAIAEWIKFQNFGRPGRLKIEVYYLEKEPSLEFVTTALSGLETYCPEGSY